MGICLDTEANMAPESEDPGADWKGGGNVQSGRQRTPAEARMLMQNAGKIKFDPPKVPVIFVLGGPGSGKVTHCDTLMQEKRGIVHINMMDLLQQYAIGNDMQDFSQLSSKTVTEVLMLEMKMAPAAKAYLISGYPRSMRDVVEYTEKIQVVNGVVLISWRQSVLQKQIDYGAKLGHVVLSLAKMELENFFKNVMPVADYFDQSDLLIAVNGERSPSDVYKDFRAAVLDILEALENQEAILNGVTGMGKGINDIPGSIVSVETAPSQQKNITEMNAERDAPNHEQNDPTSLMGQNVRYPSNSNTNATTATLGGGNTRIEGTNSMPSNGDIPPVIWVIGGPGSNKSSLCMKVLSLNLGWGHISLGRLLRSISDSSPRANTDNYTIKEALSAGEMAPERNINKILEYNMQQLSDKRGIIIDGYPRNLDQVKYFENKYKQIPPIILLDCSKLQLGRGRIDDTVSSFRRRLELFRELTLPMLRVLDSSNRLTIVDGDTDSPSVQKEFERVIRNQIQLLTGSQTQFSYAASGAATAALRNNPGPNMNNINHNNNVNNIGNNAISNSKNTTDAILQDIEDNVPGVVPTISHHVSMTNGYLRNSSGKMHNQQNQQTTEPIKGQQSNGYLPNGGIGSGVGRGGGGGGGGGGGFNFRHMLEEAERYPIDSFM